MLKVLIADDEEFLGTCIQESLQRLGYHTSLFFNGRDALTQLKSEEYDVAVLDICMPEMDGIAVLRGVQEIDTPPEVLIMTAYATVETALQAMKLGAYDYLQKPFNLSEMEELVKKAAEKRRLKLDNLRLHSQLERKQSSPKMVIASGRMKSLMERLERVASTDFPVIITGETGTGKEMIAQTLHRLSPRAGGSFIDINCAAIPESMIESELFGYEAGAFTSARGRKQGLIEMASGGTLFLDEVTELSLPLQAKMLRTIETKTFYRLGSTRKLNSDFRIVTATNRNIKEALQEGKLREDFYYRISNLLIEVPPLRERPEDIEAISKTYLQSLKGEQASFEEGVMEVFRSYSWPGNIRELKIVIERAVIMSNGQTIRRADLPLEIIQQGEPQVIKGEKLEIDMRKRKAILEALERCNWHQGKAAKALGLSPSTLYRKMKALRIKR